MPSGEARAFRVHGPRVTTDQIESKLRTPINWYGHLGARDNAPEPVYLIALGVPYRSLRTVNEASSKLEEMDVRGSVQIPSPRVFFESGLLRLFLGVY